MDRFRRHKPPTACASLGLAKLVRAAAGDESSDSSTVVGTDGELDVVQLSSVVAAQATGTSGPPAPADGLVQAATTDASTPVGASSTDAHQELLSFVPDRRVADRHALAISDWATRQGRAVIEFLYLENARLGQLPTPEAQVNAIESLQACQHALGLPEPPSRGRYRAWLDEQPAEMDWASPTNIATACGNWARARAAAAGEPLVPIGAASAGRLGGYPSDEALLDLLRQWHAVEPDPRRRFRRFKAWVLAELEGTEAHVLAARVISNQTYAKRFGSWAASVAKAGLLEGMSFDAFKRLVGTPRKVPTEDLEKALTRWAAWARDEGQRLTAASLRQWREVVLAHNWKNGIPEGVPNDGTVTSRWGTFLDALVAVELISDDDALCRRLERGDRLPTEEVAAIVRTARREHGGELNHDTYEAFRKAKSRELGRSVPRALTVINRFGARNFDHALELAERMGVGLESDIENAEEGE